MLPFTIRENIFVICLVLFLAAGVYSQITTDDSQQRNRFRSCDVGSYCIPIRRCSAFRDGWNRKGVGITCGYGIGPYRLVCCPRSHRQGVSNQQTRRPPMTTLVPPSVSEDNKNCGVSHGIDWFHKHAMEDPDAMEATWPWMVAIERVNSSGSFEHWCTGFLIDKIHVLSTAHCFTGRHKEKYMALIGSDELDSAEEYAISEIKPNENYNTTRPSGDIAILTLAREVNVSNFVPVCLPDDRVSRMALVGWGSTIVAWGTDGENETTVNSLKQLDNVPIVSHEDCNQVYQGKIPGLKVKFSGVISEYMLCAGQTEGSVDVCWGASGAPMMILYRKRWFAVGMQSFGPSCGLSGFPTVYTRISKYLEWIRQNIENSSYPIPSISVFPQYINIIDPR